MKLYYGSDIEEMSKSEDTLNKSEGNQKKHIEAYQHHKLAEMFHQSAMEKEAPFKWHSLTDKDKGTKAYQHRETKAHHKTMAEAHLRAANVKGRKPSGSTNPTDAFYKLKGVTPEKSHEHDKKLDKKTVKIIKDYHNLD